VAETETPERRTQLADQQPRDRVVTSLPSEPSIPAVEKVLMDRYPDLTRDEVERFTVLPPGTDLEQGAVYFDLRHPDRGPFKALGGHVAGDGDLLIAKRTTDYELWNRVVPDDRGEETDATVERPPREAHGVANEAGLNDSP
jgi:hypothetical protein